MVKGYQNGMFKPDADITRAEFIALVNRAFGFTDGAKSNFSDVSQNDWFAADIARAVAAGYISGYKDDTVRPNDKITRQEAAIMIARILKLDASAGSSAVNKFIDAKAIPLWSKGDIGAVVDKGLMNGYPDHTFRPEGYMTRVEVIVILDRALNIKQKVTGYEQPGTYGPQAGMYAVPYRHIILTVSDRLWKYFEGNAKMQKVMLDAAGKVMKEIVRKFNSKKKKIEPGIIMVFQSRTAREGVELIEKNPFATSLAGQFKFMARYGLSSHGAAACVIARRGLEFRLEKPPQTQDTVINLPAFKRNQTRGSRWVAIARKIKRDLTFDIRLALLSADR